MTDDERIRRRTAPEPVHGGPLPNTAAASAYRESINGRRTPELFFAYELFDYLLWGVPAGTKRYEVAHRVFDPKVRSFGYDPDQFWSTLGSVAQPYLATRDAHRKSHHNTTILTRPDGGQVVVPLDREVCAARIKALTDARRLLGGKDFDRFLYVAVAPQVDHVEGGTPSDRAEELRYMAGGCR